MDREKAVKRCRNCNYCVPITRWDGVLYMSCSLCSDRWIVEVEKCPREEKEE